MVGSYFPVVIENHQFGTLRCRWVGAVHGIIGGDRAVNKIVVLGGSCALIDINGQGLNDCFKVFLGDFSFDLKLCETAELSDDSFHTDSVL